MEVLKECREGLTLCGLLFKKRPVLSRSWIVLLILAFTFFFIPPTWAESFEIHFIDVKRGDSILMRTPEGSAVLVDTGFGSTGPELVQYLKDQEVRELDFLILTHYDNDHIGAASLILQEFNTGSVFDNGQDLDPPFEDPESIKTYQTRIRSGSGYRVLRAGQTLQLDKMRIDVLWPPSGELPSRDWNANSIVLKIHYGAAKILLTGDLLKESEKQLLKRGVDLEAEILKVGHHGSRAASSDPFLDEVGAEVAVVCAWEGKPGKPSSRTLKKFEERQIEVYQTDRHGTIRILVRPGGSWQAVTEKSQKGV